MSGASDAGDAPPPPTVVILGLDEGPEAGTASVLAERLMALGARRVGVATGTSECAIHRRELWDATGRVPAPEDGIDAFAEGLAEIVAMENADIVIPATFRHEAAAALARSKNAALRRAIPPRFGTGVIAPKTLDVVAKASRGRIRSAPSVHGAPVAAEYWIPAYNWPFPCELACDDGSRRRVVDGADARARLKAAASRGVVAAELRIADPSRAFETAVVLDARGKPLAAATARTVADDSALRTWSAVTCLAGAVEAEAAALARAAGYVGAVVCSGTYVADGVVWRHMRPGFPHWLGAAAAGGVDLVAVRIAAHLRRPFTVRLGADAGWMFSQSADDVLARSAAEAAFVSSRST